MCRIQLFDLQENRRAHLSSLGTGPPGPRLLGLERNQSRCLDMEPDGNKKSADYVSAGNSYLVEVVNCIPLLRFTVLGFEMPTSGRVTK